MLVSWRAALVTLAFVLIGCETAKPHDASPAPTELSPALSWVVNSAAYAAITRETYARATEVLPNHFRRDQVVVTDADETLLDNSEYQVRQETGVVVHTEANFTNWVLERKARTVPGALSFLRAVIQRRGRIVVITNREPAGVSSVDAVEGATMDNLGSRYYDAFHESMPVTQVCILARILPHEDKTERRNLVQSGALQRCEMQTPHSQWVLAGGYSVIAYVGDQPGDFPCFSEEDAGALRDEAQLASSRCDRVDHSSRFTDLFQRKYFLLPQPLYGAWRREPRQ